MSGLPFGAVGWNPMDLVNQISPAYNVVSSGNLTAPIRAISSVGSKGAGGILSGIGKIYKTVSPAMYDLGSSLYNTVSPVLYKVGSKAYKLARPAYGLVKSGAKSAYSYVPSVMGTARTIGRTARAAYRASPSFRDAARFAARTARGAYNYASPVINSTKGAIKRVSPVLLGAGAAALAGYNRAKPMLTQIAKHGKKAAYMAPFILGGASMAGLGVPASALLAAEYASTAAGIGDTLIGDSPEGKIGAGIHAVRAAYKLHSANSRKDSIGQLMDLLQGTAHGVKSMMELRKIGAAEKKFGGRSCRYDSRGKKYRSRIPVRRY